MGPLAGVGEGAAQLARFNVSRDAAYSARARRKVLNPNPALDAGETAAALLALLAEQEEQPRSSKLEVAALSGGSRYSLPLCTNADLHGLGMSQLDMDMIRLTSLTEQ